MSVLLISVSAYASEEIGVVSATNPTLQAISAEQKERKLKTGDPIFYGDTIITNDKGNAQLTFKDKSTLTIASNTHLTIDSFVYDPASARGEFNASVTKGTFRFIGGILSKSKPVTFRTPAAIIGIQGSSSSIMVTDEKVTVAHTNGTNTVFNTNDKDDNFAFDSEGVLILKNTEK